MESDADDKKKRAREATKRWRAANRERANALARANQKKWREANPERHRARAKEWKEANYDKYISRHRKWCAENRERLNEYRRKQHYKQKYGITEGERDAMLVEQGGCAACGTNDPGNKIGWVIDHNHQTGVVRGILCHHCNVGIGIAKESITTLAKWIAYLEKHRTND